MTGVLAVCHANICRSPLSAAALGRSQVLTAYGISSRGTSAIDGAPMCELSHSMAEDLGIQAAPEHLSRRLTRGATHSSYLILTAERDQRGFVARLSLEARSHTFTILEALGLAREIAANEPLPFRDLPSFVAALHDARGYSAPMDRLDISDGHGLSRRRHHAATRTISQASLEFAALVDRLVTTSA